MDATGKTVDDTVYEGEIESLGADGTDMEAAIDAGTGNVGCPLARPGAN